MGNRKKSDQKRTKIIEEYKKRYCSKLDILKTNHLPSSTEKSNMTVVIPAYNEENYIGNLLIALEAQTYRNFEVIVVDNGSRDGTVGLVKKMKKKVGYPLYLIFETKPGPGHARKRGMDAALLRVKSQYGYKYPKHILVTTDADAVPPKDWLSEIAEAFESSPSGVFAGTHGSSPAIDKKIRKKLGFKKYFNQIPELIEFLNKNEIGELKPSGPNCSFEIEAYVVGDGMQQPYDKQGRIALKEVPQLAFRIKKKGYPIRFLNVRITTSRRRHLFELISQSHPYYHYCRSLKTKRFIAVKEKESDLLDLAFKKVPKERWQFYQQKWLKEAIKLRIPKPLGKRKTSLVKRKISRLAIGREAKEAFLNFLKT